jgi:diguanylate cyclase (GGDEF)-like protein
MSLPDALEEKVARLRASYLQKLPAQLEALRQAYATLASGPIERKDCVDLHRRFHTLRGGSASFGFATLAAIAAGGEQGLKALLDGGCDPEAFGRCGLEGCLERLDEEARRTDGPVSRPALPLDLAPPVAVPEESRQKTIYVCDDDPLQCRVLATQLGCFGFEVVPFEDLDACRDAALRHPPDALVMDMEFPDRLVGGAEIALELQEKHGTPTVFLTVHGDLPNRLAAVRAGATAYFVKPVNAADLSSTLHALTQLEEEDPARILIVDDDPALSGLYAITLQETGMVTRVVNDPLGVLPDLIAFKPDLILMDMHMPGCSGLDLARVIRQIDSYLSIPIVFLSAETDPDLQIHARRMGGDEFLTKPIRPDHLVAAVAVRAARMKLLRSLMVRDGMTGLYNYTISKAMLAEAVDRARRSGGGLCFGMIDVDLFKRVNDTYGHSVGDRVLVALARLLKQRLRKSDLIGRYGGEEFAVILPDCSTEEAVARLDQLRESFNGIRFTVGDAVFSVSFSCGVASFQHFRDADQLCQAADEALYAAKREGRNQVRTPAEPARA